MIKATYFETFCGNDYFRDMYGNIYTKVGNDVAFCSNLKQGHLTEDKAEPSYPVLDVQLIKKAKESLKNLDAIIVKGYVDELNRLKAGVTNDR